MAQKIPLNIKSPQRSKPYTGSVWIIRMFILLVKIESQEILKNLQSIFILVTNKYCLLMDLNRAYVTFLTHSWTIVMKLYISVLVMQCMMFIHTIIEQ